MMGKSDYSSVKRTGSPSCRLELRQMATREAQAVVPEVEVAVAARSAAMDLAAVALRGMEAARTRNERVRFAKPTVAATAARRGIGPNIAGPGRGMRPIWSKVKKMASPRC